MLLEELKTLLFWTRESLFLLTFIESVYFNIEFKFTLIGHNCNLIKVKMTYLISYNVVGHDLYIGWTENISGVEEFFFFGLD